MSSIDININEFIKKTKNEYADFNSQFKIIISKPAVELLTTLTAEITQLEEYMSVIDKLITENDLSQIKMEEIEDKLNSVLQNFKDKLLVEINKLLKVAQECTLKLKAENIKGVRLEHFTDFNIDLKSPNFRGNPTIIESYLLSCIALNNLQKKLTDNTQTMTIAMIGSVIHWLEKYHLNVERLEQFKTHRDSICFSPRSRMSVATDKFESDSEDEEISTTTKTTLTTVTTTTTLDLPTTTDASIDFSNEDGEDWNSEIADWETKIEKELGNSASGSVKLRFVRDKGKAKEKATSITVTDINFFNAPKSLNTSVETKIECENNAITKKETLCLLSSVAKSLETAASTQATLNLGTMDSARELTPRRTSVA